MKKTFAILSLVLLAAVNFAANAAKLSLTIEINDPQLALVQQYILASEATFNDLEFDSHNQCYIEYPDDASENFMSLYVTPITPEPEDENQVVDPIYFKSYKVYDSEGELIETKEVNAKNRKSINMKLSYDGGVVVLEMGTLDSSHFTLNVDGDPSKFTLSLKNRQVNGITEGTQQIAFTPDENYIYIVPKGVTQLYSVCYNGTEVEVRSDAAEGGAISHYYLIYNPTDGAVLDIVTDYPSVKYPVTIDVNDADFITSITIDDTPLLGWTGDPLEIKAGSNLHIEGNRYAYLVNGTWINGEEKVPSSSISTVIEGETTVKFDVTKIQRDYSFAIYVDNAVDASIRTNLGSYMELHAGYNLDIPFCMEDMPISLFSQSLAGDENYDRYIYINDELLSSNSSNYEITVAENDVVKIFFASSQPPYYYVDINIDASESYIPTITADYVTAVTGKSIMVLPGTMIEIEVPGDTANSTVRANAVQLAANPETGKFSLTIDQDTDIEIIDNLTGISNVNVESVNCNIYNLRGIEMPANSNLPAGIYIVNGKKIQIK